jgi:cytoskeleton protein RodZ
MDTVGSYLRQQREKAGLSLEQLGGSTKIRPALLRSLEEDQFDSLPSGVFVRGFVKAYAAETGFRADRALELLETQIAPEVNVTTYAEPMVPNEEPSGGRFKVAHLLVLVIALLTMLGAYFIMDGPSPNQSGVTSVQTTDANSGTTRSFSPVKSGSQ